MLKLIDKTITRGGEKVGWTDGRHIFDEHGTKLGFFDSDEIYDRSGKKIARVQGNMILTHNGKDLHLDDSHDHVSGGTIPDIERAAIWLLIGD